MTFDLVLQAGARMTEDAVHGPEDSVVTEMIKQLQKVNTRSQELLGRDNSGYSCGSQMLVGETD